jgi:hypothetical protein
MGPTRACSTLVALAAVAALAGCDRRPQLVPPAADSLRAGPDSFTVAARGAVQRWDEGDHDAAAGWSARVVHEALRVRPTAPWRERAQGVLDSLGIGAEVAGSDMALVVNLFSRAEAQGASWPYLFWLEPDGVRLQSIEGAGMQVVATATRGFGNDGTPSDTAQTAVLFARRAGMGQQPVAMVWRRGDGGRWDLHQSLGPDSLGGTGSAEFVAGDADVDLTTRTYRATPYFDECATCPHVFRERRFEWREGGFVRRHDEPVPSPYATFTGLIAALIAEDRARAERLVSDAALVEFARRLGWHEGARGRWRLAPTTDEGAMEMVFFRGPRDAYRVSFEARDGDWVVRGFEPTERAVE